MTWEAPSGHSRATFFSSPLVGGTVVIPPIAGPLFYRALRAASYELPEDFLLRVEPGLDEETRARLARGIRVLRTCRRVEAAMMSLFVAGGVFLVLGVGALALLRAAAGFGGPLILSTFGIWAGGVACLALLAGLVLAFRRDLRIVVAFQHALRGSSLARDLA